MDTNSEFQKCEVINWGIIGTPNGFQFSCANDNWPSEIRASMFDLSSEVLGVLTFDEWGRYPLYQLRIFSSQDGNLYTGVAAYFPAKEQQRNRSGSFFGAFVLIKDVLCSVPNLDENIYKANTDHILHFLSNLCRFQNQEFMTKETYTKNIRGVALPEISTKKITDNCFTTSYYSDLINISRHIKESLKWFAFDSPYYVNFADSSVASENLLENVLKYELIIFNYKIFFSQHPAFAKTFSENHILGLYIPEEHLHLDLQLISKLLTDIRESWKKKNGALIRLKSLQKKVSEVESNSEQLKSEKQELKRIATDLRNQLDSKHAEIKRLNKKLSEERPEPVVRQAPPQKALVRTEYETRYKTNTWVIVLGFLIGLIFGLVLCYGALKRFPELNSFGFTETNKPPVTTHTSAAGRPSAQSSPSKFDELDNVKATDTDTNLSPDQPNGTASDHAQETTPTRTNSAKQDQTDPDNKVDNTKNKPEQSAAPDHN